MVIYNHFKKIAETYPDKEIFLGQETKSYLGEKPETYFYFLERVNFTAEILSMDIPYPFYVFKSENKFDYYVNFLACNKIGKVFVPVPNDVSDDYFSEVVQQVSNSNLDDICLVLSTSGTTGKSKGVKFSEDAIYENMMTSKKTLGITDKDILWAYGSPSLAGFLTGLVTPTILSGGQIFLDDFKLLKLDKIVKEYKPTMTFIPPTTISMLKKYKRVSDKLDLSSFRKVVVSATKPTKYDITYLLDKGVQTVHHGYSASDIACSTPILGRDISSSDVDGGEDIDLTFENVYGKWEIDWVKDELIVRGPGLSTGYLESELNKGTYKNGWFHSGDIITTDLEHISRKRDIIKSRGFYISPFVIENCIKKLNYVQDCAVVSVPHRLYGEEIVAFVIDKVKDTYTTKDIIDECKHNLQKSHVPHKVIFIDKFPVTEFGHALKISKEKLRRKLGWYKIQNEWAWYCEYDYQSFEPQETNLKDIEFKVIYDGDTLLKYKKQIENGLKVFDETTNPPFPEMWDFTEAIVRIKSGATLMVLIHNDVAVSWNWCFEKEWTIPDHGWNLNIHLPHKCTYSANWWCHPKYRSNKKYPTLVLDFVYKGFDFFKSNGYKKDYTSVDGWNWKSYSVMNKIGYKGSNWLDDCYDE